MLAHRDALERVNPAHGAVPRTDDVVVVINPIQPRHGCAGLIHGLEFPPQVQEPVNPELLVLIVACNNTFIKEQQLRPEGTARRQAPKSPCKRGRPPPSALRILPHRGHS